MLIQQAEEGLIELKYLDEAGFCLESLVSYSYSRTGEQKCLEQHLKSYGSRISILGLWQVGQNFDYALAQGGFKGLSYIKVMDWVAVKAAKTLSETGHITVVVQDNGSLHCIVKWFVNSGNDGKSKDYTFSFCRPIVRK